MARHKRTGSAAAAHSATIGRVVIKKLSKPAVGRREAPRAPTAVARRRSHAHSLAPEHIGEAGSVALLAITIVGLALLIAAIAIVVSGITAGSRYSATTAPPNVGSLGIGQIVGGSLLALLSLALVGSAAAVLAELRRSRMIAALVSGAAAILGIVGVVIVMSQSGGDQVLAGALVVVTLIFAAAAIILARPHR
jgi:hypothetical protein